MADVILTKTLRYHDQAGGKIPAGKYIWRGPTSDPVFSLQNCRDMVSDFVEVVCEKPTAAIVAIERTKTGPGVIPSTMHGFSRWKIQGNGLALRGFWCRATIDENNEHMEFRSNAFHGVDMPFVFEGQQSKHHWLAHNVIEAFDTAVMSDTAFHWQGGTIAAGGTAFALTRVGDPVKIESVGVEATAQLLITDEVSTASQPILLENVRYEADQIISDGKAIVLRHAGPLTILSSRLGGGKQAIPRIAIKGTGTQSLTIRGVTFGSYGAYRTSPIVAQNKDELFLSSSGNVFQRNEGDGQNTQPFCDVDMVVDG